MLVLHPNWKARPVRINHVRLTRQQLVQRRMFNQMRLVNMLPTVRTPNRTIIAEKIKLMLLMGEVLRWNTKV